MIVAHTHMILLTELKRRCSTSFIDVRKQAVLKKVEKAWKIDDIEIIKSYIE